MKKFFIPFVLSLFLLGSFSALNAQENEKKQKLTSEAKQAREDSLQILSEMEEIVQEYYYDPKFRGIDLKARIETAKARVKTLEYNWQMYRVLVQVLMDFNDSHTFLTLPARDDYFQYGFGLQMIGDECYVTSVKKDSNAQKSGIEVGDQVLLLGKFKPTRRDLWKMMYVIYKLDPSNVLDLKIRKPDGTEKSLSVTAKTMTQKEYRAELKSRKEKKKYEPFKCQEINAEIVACKLFSFSVERSDIDKMMKQAAKYPKLILDLRGNGGGFVHIEQYLLSYFFPNEIKIADLVTRKKTETRMTKPVSEKQYKGEIAVLIDSDSASASEMTARALQVEKRGKIYGDISSGSVMTSIWMPFKSVVSAFADYAIIKVGMSVTVADVIMRDGSRLENTGVVPDEILQPTAAGLAKKTDPVLAYAAGKFGAELSPEKAGSMYFMVEKDESGDDEGNDDGK